MGCMESKTNPNHEPTAVRGCTDVFWLCLYVVFWLLMIVVAIFSFVYGNPLRLIYGYDSFGNTCGVAHNERFPEFPLSGKNTLNTPNIFFLSMEKLRATIKICVKECPKKRIANSQELYQYYQESQSKLCRYDFNMDFLKANDNKYSSYLGPCPTYPVYESTPVLHRCVPTDRTPEAFRKKVYALLNSLDVAQQFFSDLYLTWPLIALLSFVALVLSIFQIILMHWLTKIVSWLICIFVAVASIALTIILWWTYYNITHKSFNNEKYSLLEEYVRNETFIYVLAIVVTILMICLLVILYFMRTKIGGLAALFEEAGNCMLSLPGLAIPPILAFGVLVIFLAFWVVVVICLATSSYPKMESVADLQNAVAHNTTNIPPTKDSTFDISLIPSSTKFQYVETHWLHKMLWLYLIGLIWTSEFIFACQQLAIAGAVAYWYFRKPTDSPVLHAMAKLIKYHLGSCAKGSLIITLFKIPRLILTYLYTKLTKSDNDCAKCGLKCCICCFWMLEKFIRYLNHNAYTVIAIESVNFCPAAGIAWNAMASNALQVATINGIGDFVLFLGKVFVAVICGLVGVLVLRDNEELNFYIIPVILISLFAFFIAHVVLSLYEIVVDTLFLCVCEDKTINGPSGRWKQSNLAKLVGEEPVAVEEQVIQAVEMTPINKQPFSRGGYTS